MSTYIRTFICCFTIVQLGPRRRSCFSRTYTFCSAVNNLNQMPPQPATTKLADERVSKHNMSPALTRSRSRKVQPALKERAEAFLAKASADMSSPLKPKDVPSRKRKRASLDTQVKQSQALLSKIESSGSEAVRKVSKTTKISPEEVLERLDASQGLAPAPLVDEEDVEPLMSRTQAKKALTAKAKEQEDANEPQEKRLKIFRKQAPNTFHEKLQRATLQR